MMTLVLIDSLINTINSNTNRWSKEMEINRVNNNDNRIIVDGYIRECRINNIHCSINSICYSYFIPCFSLFFISSPEYPDDTDSIKCKSELINNNLQIMSTSYLSLHLIDINNKYMVQGLNDENQLGFKNIKFSQTEDIDELTVNDFLNESDNIIYITNSTAEYSKHMFVKTDKNEIYSFGCNDSSQCGYKNEETDKKYEPKLVKYFIMEKINIIQIKKGDKHTLFLSDNQIIYGCGSNKYCQLGLKEKIIYNEIINLSERMTFPSSFGLPIKQIECMCDSTIIMDSNHILYGMGSNDYGNLGFDIDNMVQIDSITKLNICNKVLQFKCGCNHICLMDKSYQIITFGLNINGQCGVPLNHPDRKIDDYRVELIHKPIVINQFFENKHININNKWKIICGYYSTYIIDDKYNIYTFGDNSIGGCLIDGKMRNIYSPTFVDNKTILTKFTNGRKIVSLVGTCHGVYIVTE